MAQRIQQQKALREQITKLEAELGLPQPQEAAK
jgi:hypothetical protein